MSEKPLSDVTTQNSILEELQHDAGNRSAFGRLLIRYHGPIAEYCAAAFRVDEDTAHDIAHRVIDSLMHRLSDGWEYRPDMGRFRAYLKTAAHHAVMSEFRRRKSEAHAAGGDTADALLDQLSDESRVAEVSRKLETEFHMRLLEEAETIVQTRFAPTTWQVYVLTKNSIVNDANLLSTTTSTSRLSGAEIGAQLGLSRDAVYAARLRVNKELTKAMHELLKHAQGTNSSDSAPVVDSDVSEN